MAGRAAALVDGRTNPGKRKLVTPDPQTPTLTPTFGRPLAATFGVTFDLTFGKLRARVDLAVANERGGGEQTPAARLGP